MGPSSGADGQQISDVLGAAMKNHRGKCRQVVLVLAGLHLIPLHRRERDLPNERIGVTIFVRTRSCLGHS
jgi:hypothetical protein